jgi:hypothetical protein
MTPVGDSVRSYSMKFQVCEHPRVEVERTVTYRRKVCVEVEETDERLKDEKDSRWKGYIFKPEAEDAAVEKAPTLTAWEPDGATEYRAVSAEQVDKPHNEDVIV